MIKVSTFLAGAILGATLLGNAQARCTGDCDGDSAVAINELITCVNRALDLPTAGPCTACDGNGDSLVTIDEIIAGVNIALGVLPCGVTPTVGPTGTATATPTATPSGDEMTQCCVAAYYVWACEQHTVAECAALKGLDNGPGVCSPNPCGDLPPSDSHGICCLPNAAGDEIECEDRKASDCVAAGGVVKASGTVCSAATCADVPPPNVRCCVAKHAGTVVECEDLTAAACAAQGGIDMGAGTCTPDPCNP
jgi:hypothetical protein